MPELDGLSQRCFRGLFLEAFNNSSGRAFANRFSGAVCDRRGLEHPALVFWTIQEVVARAVLAPNTLLSLGASVGERCVLLEGKQVDVCKRKAGWAAAWHLADSRFTPGDCHHQLGALEPGGLSLVPDGSMSSSPGPSDLPQPGSRTSWERAISQIKPDNSNSPRHPCQETSLSCFPLLPALENLLGVPVATTAACFAELHPTHLIFQSAFPVEA